MTKFSHATRGRRASAAERQQSYRKRQKTRRKPSTEDIAITSFHHMVTTGTSPEAKRHFSVLTDQIIGKLVGLGFDPVASRMAFDDLVDRYEAGEVLTRGPNNTHGRPDISAFLPKPNQSPHNSMSRGDDGNLGVDARALIVETPMGANHQRELVLSTAHVSSTDLELLLEEAVFGNAFGVRVKGSALVVSLDGLVPNAEEEIRQRHNEGYSDAFCEILLVANDLGVDVVTFAADGGVCRDLCLFEGNTIMIMRPFKRFVQHL